MKINSYDGEGWSESTNDLSNNTPQKSALNQGPWVRLESAVRTIESKTGLNIFHGLKAASRDSLENSPSILLPELGCSS